MEGCGPPSSPSQDYCLHDWPCFKSQRQAVSYASNRLPPYLYTLSKPETRTRGVMSKHLERLLYIVTF